MKYTEDEQRKINFQKAQIKRAKDQINGINSQAKMREEAASKKAAEDRIAKWKMDIAREKFRTGYRKLMLDAKNADRTYNLAVVEASLAYQDLDTATIMIKVQRLP